MMDEESSHDIKILQSYEDDEVGSLVTTNFIVIHDTLSIRQAMDPFNQLLAYGLI